MSLVIMQHLWYIVIALSAVFYVILDGFDLGVGSLQLFAGSDRNKRIFLNSIGPFWDGNEIWLIIVFGALFAGFPDVYALFLSGLYDLFMCLLAAIILRAIAIEFRSKHESKSWRATWDILFCAGSLFITFLVGIFLGNSVRGYPLTADRELYYGFGELFNSYTICIGLMSIALFAMHGNYFLILKTENTLQARLKRWAPWTTSLFYLFFIVATAWTWTNYPYMLQPFIDYKIFCLIPVFLLMTLVSIAICNRYQYHGLSFVSSMASISLLLLLFGIGLYPNIVLSSTEPDLLSLTLFNSSADASTLTICLIIALIGIPLVLLYGWILYRAFHGKTEIHDHSY